MSKREIQQIPTKSLAKGLLAGLVGGLVATKAKKLAKRVYPPQIPSGPEPPLLLARTTSPEPRLTITKKTVSADTIHWGFGAAAGAAYGAVAEYYPPATARDGAAFGLTLVSMTQEGALPFVGSSNNPEDQTMRARTSEMVTYVVFGMVTETVRRVVRRMLR